jgi:hypothetical protein
MGARNRVVLGLTYRPVRLHRLADSIPRIRFLGSFKVENSASDLHLILLWIRIRVRIHNEVIKLRIQKSPIMGHK